MKLKNIKDNLVLAGVVIALAYAGVSYKVSTYENEMSTQPDMIQLCNVITMASLGSDKLGKITAKEINNKIVSDIDQALEDRSLTPVTMFNMFTFKIAMKNFFYDCAE